MRGLSSEIRNALRLRDAGQKRAALKLLEQLARVHKSNALIWFHFAETSDALGHERQAIPRYHRALRLDPSHPHLYEMLLYLSSSYRKTGRPRAAQRYLAAACKLGRRSALQVRLQKLIARDLAGRAW